MISMAKRKRSGRRTQKRPAQPLATLRPPPDPTLCPICERPFTVIVGCHKVCRCGYQEGCGD
jgi:hypothetical protein